MSELVTLTTDYGTADAFVAICHGVIHGIAPHVRVIDISHHIRPGDVRAGAVLLEDALADLPVGVHVGVVDPGVGTARLGIAVGTARGDVLVGPDNGLLLWAASSLGDARSAVALSDPRWHRTPVGKTFHGRDVFAPVAAHLAAGVALEELGPAIELDSLQRLPELECRVESGACHVEVRAVDHFGNVQLAARVAQLEPLGRSLRLVDGPELVAASTFAELAADQLGLIEDSVGRGAIVANGASAADRLHVAPGQVLHLIAKAG